MEQMKMEGFNTPIEVFHDNSELMNCLRWWQHKLFLDDWVIKGKLVDSLVDASGKELCGNNEFQICNRSAFIRVAKDSEEMRDCIVKNCMECTLVHELLHCKYNWTSKRTDSVEYSYYDTLEHGLIEQMAKSLIMVKYNLPFDYFINF